MACHKRFPKPLFAYRAILPSLMFAPAPAQMSSGQALYGAVCATCHGAELQGGTGVQLSGAAFTRHWLDGQHSVGDFYTTIKNEMPLPKPGSLSSEQYTDIVSYILSRNGFVAGPNALGPDSFQTKLVSTAAVVAATAEPAAPRPSMFPAPPDGTGKAATSLPDDADLRTNDPADWLTYNKGLMGQRYSALSQINTRNASQLTPTCVFQTGENVQFEDSPVIYKGMMYVTTPWTTYAVHADTCETGWETTSPGVSDSLVIETRGLAIYKGKLLRTTPDGHLLALDAQTGRTLWSVWVSDLKKGYSLSAAPVAWDGKVFIGEAGADMGAHCHIYAFNAETGRRIWTFDTIPTGDQPGARSWESGAEHGGGSVWSSFSIDPEARRVYVSTGNPAPDFDGAARPGDNLYTDSVVALDIDTGHLASYAQQIPHDLHDWDTAAAAALYDQGGRGYMAVANKGGWLYIYDRHTNALLSRQEVSRHIDDEKALTTTPLHLCPGTVGGVQWNGPAYSPKTGAIFVNSVEWCGTQKLIASSYIEGSAYYGGIAKLDPAAEGRGWTRGFNATTGRPLWVRPSPTPMLSALTPTAGDVIFTGDLAGNFLVLDAVHGTDLYRFHTGGAAAGAVSTYMVNGRQYVAQAAGHLSAWWRTKGSASIFVFALPDSTKH